MSFNDFKAIIPVRMGSSRIKDKALLKLNNETILQRKIKQLKNVLPPENIIVNTESEILASIAVANGVQVHYRDEYYADGHKASFSELIMHVIDKVESEIICWCPVVTPFMNEEAFNKCFLDYREKVIEGEYDSLVSVTEEKHYWWADGKPLNYKADKNHTISQDLPKWFKVNNGLYIASKKTMLRKEYILGDKVYLSKVSNITSIDIDTWEDYLFAKGMLEVTK